MLGEPFSANRNYEAVLEFLPYILQAALKLWPCVKGEQVVALYTIYMICITLLFIMTGFHGPTGHNYSKLKGYTDVDIKDFDMWTLRYFHLRTFPFNVPSQVTCYVVISC